MSETTITEDAQGKQLYDRLNELFALDSNIDELGLVLNASPASFQSTIDEDNKNNKNNNTNESKLNETKIAQLLTDSSLNDKEEGPPYLLHSHKLGLAFWALPPLFHYATKIFRSIIYKGISKKQGMKSVQKDIKLEELDLRIQLELLYCTRTIVLINADNYTAWNWRKKLILLANKNGENNNISLNRNQISHEIELKLLNLVYSKHPKSGEAWAHRRWILNGFIEINDLSNNHIQLMQLLHKEIKVCEAAADLYPKNYYAWSHRQYIVHLFPNSSDLLDELNIKMKQWCEIHISDYSAFHHRQIILIELANRFSKHQLQNQFAVDFFNIPIITSHGDSSHNNTECIACNSLDSEMKYLDDMIDNYPGHETHWNHRRFLIQFQLAFYIQHQQSLGNIPITSTMLWDYISTEFEYCDLIISDELQAEHKKQVQFATLHKLYTAECVLQYCYSNKAKELLQKASSNNNNNNSNSTELSLLILSCLTMSDIMTYRPLLESVKKIWNFPKAAIWLDREKFLPKLSITSK